MDNGEEPGQGLPGVLIVSAYAEPHLGGVEVVVGQQARSLAALGHPVTVVTSRCDKKQPAHERTDGFDIVRVPAWNGLELRTGVPLPVWSPNALWRLRAMIRDVDIVHVHDVYHAASLLAGGFARLRKRPLFITQHVAIVEHDRAVVTAAQRLVYATIARRLWRWAATITAYNPIVQEFIIQHGTPAAKIKLAYNGVDTAEFSPGDADAAIATRARYGLPTDVPIVLFVGRLVPKKGLQNLLDARGPEYHLAIVGPGKIPEDVPEGVTFLGPVDRRDLRRIYQASDIFAYPAVGEMLTLAMQEAMSCGLPVVATSDAAYSRYQLDPAGIALVSPEPGTLRSTFLDILGDPARLSHMRAYSRSLAESRFDWRRNAEHLAADYLTACGSCH